MKTSFRVFKEDILNTIKNPVALFIIVGLCLIPSLYAWVNIKACWNPYINTGNLPVAVVNNDQGTTIEGKEVNVGNQIVNQLKKNKDIGWKFVNSWNGDYGLHEGKYYALIEIPSDFSRELGTLITSKPEKPNIIYRVNEKANAIATKITDVAKDKLAKEIKANFVETVNNEAFKVLNSFGKDIETNKPAILQLKDSLTYSNENIQKIKDYIGNANNISKNLQTYLDSANGRTSVITDEINNLQEVAQSAKSLIVSTKGTVNSASSKINNDIIGIQYSNQRIQDLLKQLKNINNTTQSKEEELKIIDSLSDATNNMKPIIDSIINSLKVLEIMTGKPIIKDAINSFEGLKTSLDNGKVKLNKLKEDISSNKSKEEVNSSIDDMSNLNNSIFQQIISALNKIYTIYIPGINEIGNGLVGEANVAESMLQSMKIISPQINALAGYSMANSKVVDAQSKGLTDALNKLQGSVVEVQDKTKEINEENIDKIVNLMEKDPDIVAKFLSSPINVKQVDLYNAEIFGIGLTPFYSVLAIWVGILLASALLTEEKEELNNGEKVSIMQSHFGKMMTFMLISFIQSFIVVLGDKYVLGVNPDNMPLLLGFTLLTSITFTIIIFTMASLFGDVGKAIVIFIMVFQIAGSGGIYPIQTNPKIFQILEPVWPFTYAIDGFREAIAGVSWDAVYKDVRALLIFAAIFLALGLFKKTFYKITKYMAVKFQESGL